MALQLDTSTEFGARVARRLRDEELIWLTTVAPAGTPQPSPVWFLAQCDTLLIFSQPNTPKLRNIGRNPRVALNFHANATGGDVVVFTGEATIKPALPPAAEINAYVEKYREGIRRIGLTPESMLATYSAPIRIRLERVRGH